MRWHALQIDFGAQTLELTTERALFWARESCLVLSDLHLGKAGHFRKHGFAMPGVVHEKDLARLRALLEHYAPEKVIIAGDLVHAGANREWEDFKNLTAEYARAEWILVAGNHDRKPLGLMRDLGLSAVHERLEIGPFDVVHEPVADADTERFLISGHVHPGVSVRMTTRRLMNFPCFAVAGRQLILPAFSVFSGLDTRTITNAAFYAFYEGGFFEVHR